MTKLMAKAKKIWQAASDAFSQIGEKSTKGMSRSSHQDNAMAYPMPKGKKGRARVAVITVIEEEFDAARQILGANYSIPSTQYFATTSSQDAQWDLVLAQCVDRSQVPANEITNEVIEDFRPQIILLVGIAGGLCDGETPREGIALGDVVIAEFVDYVEFLKITNTGIVLRHMAYDHPSVALRKTVSFLLQREFDPRPYIQIQPPAGNGAKIHIGPIASAEKVLGGVHNEVQIALLKPFDKALAIDMESYGVARAVCARRTSFWYHPRYVVIRGISDLGGTMGSGLAFCPLPA